MVAEAIETLNASREPRALKRALVKLANSSDQQAYAHLSQRLNDRAFLTRLDDEASYAGSHHRLRLASVLRALWVNEHPLAQQMLTWLTSAEGYLADTSRIMLLLRASASLRPPAEQVVAFWRRYGRADSPLLYNTVHALILNQSDAAMALFQQLLAQTPGIDLITRASWLHELVLPRRNDLPLLGACERVAASTTDAALQLTLFDALFDYQPDVWYVDCDKPSAPAYATAPPEAKAAFRRIATLAEQTYPLTEAQAALVKPITEGSDV